MNRIKISDLLILLDEFNDGCVKPGDKFTRHALHAVLDSIDYYLSEQPNNYFED